VRTTHFWNNLHQEQQEQSMQLLKEKMTKGQTMFYKTLQRKLMIELNLSNTNTTKFRGGDGGCEVRCLCFYLLMKMI